MKIKMAIFAYLLLPMMISQADAACRCQCVAGKMAPVCDNAMMDMPTTCAPTACRTNQPAAGQQPSTNPASNKRCREERVCDSYGTCRMDRICN